MDGEIILGGQKYISSKRLSKGTHYTHDYISRLCREKKIKGKLIGRNWFVIPRSLSMHEKLTKESNVKRGKSTYLDYKAIGKNENTHETPKRVVDNPINESTHDAWETLLFSQEEKKTETNNFTQDKITPINIKKIYISPKRSHRHPEKDSYFKKYRQNDLQNDSNIPATKRVFKKRKVSLGLFFFLHSQCSFLSTFIIATTVGMIFFITIMFTDTLSFNYNDKEKQGLLTTINSLISDRIIVIFNE